jgi:Fe-S-cluster-containing dehydrogenase component
MPISVLLEKCTGCMLCSLACSVVRTGGFNPKKARIRITKSLSGIPIAFEIHEECPDACRADKRPVCVEICPFDALRSGEGHES